jgi:hypothetical protein
MTRRATIKQADIARVLRAVADHAPGARVVIDLGAARVEIINSAAPAESAGTKRNPLDRLLETHAKNANP